MDDRLAAAFDARDRAYRAIGEVDPDVITHLINPAFMGGPAWPSLRQGWRTIRRPKSTLIVSDGLSDPFEDREQDSVGFGLELAIETPDPIDDLPSSWPFSAVYDVSQTAAGHGGVRTILDELGLISVEVGGNRMPPEWVSSEGRVGVLLGIEAPWLPREIVLPAGMVRLVTIKALTLGELDEILSGGDEARTRLAKRFAESGEYHLSSAKR